MCSQIILGNGEPALPMCTCIQNHFSSIHNLFFGEWPGDKRCALNCASAARRLCPSAPFGQGRGSAFAMANAALERGSRGGRQSSAWQRGQTQKDLKKGNATQQTFCRNTGTTLHLQQEHPVPCARRMLRNVEHMLTFFPHRVISPGSLLIRGWQIFGQLRLQTACASSNFHGTG